MDRECTVPKLAQVLLMLKQVRENQDNEVAVQYLKEAELMIESAMWEVNE